MLVESRISYGFLGACPNLVSLTIERIRAFDMVTPFFYISSMEGLRELSVSIEEIVVVQGWQRDVVQFLSAMANLRKLELHVYGFTHVMQRYLAWTLPRLEECEIDSDGVGVEWDRVISSKKNGLCRVALTIPLGGDMSRELAEYL
jgi:hypothetical protein